MGYICEKGFLVVFRDIFSFKVVRKEDTVIFFLFCGFEVVGGGKEGIEGLSFFFF